jgi:hypothetical protein
MTRLEALKHLRVMLFAVQKARSNLMEAVGDDETGNKVNSDLNPWLFGARSVLPSLVKYLDRIEAGAPINGSDFYNFMTIAARSPVIAVTAMTGDDVLPEPDMSWCAQIWK